MADENLRAAYEISCAIFDYRSSISIALRLGASADH
jgi:hypothetical protein